MANNLSSQVGLAWVGAAQVGQAYDVPGSLDPGSGTQGRVSQVMAEVLLIPQLVQSFGRVSQVMAEVLLGVVNPQVFGRVSQVMVEVLAAAVPFVPPPSGTTGHWFGDLEYWEQFDFDPSERFDEY